MNKKETVYEALANVKREYVEEAANYDFKKRHISWQRVLGIAAAACLVVAMAAIAIIPKRERNPWATNNPTANPISSGSPIETGDPITTGAPDYESLAFVGRNKICDIPMVKYISVPTNSQLGGSRAEALGYLGDPAGAVGPVGLTAASDDRFILLDQVCKRLFTIGRDGSIGAHFLDICSRPRAIAYLDGADPSLGDPVISPEDSTVVNDDGSQYAILDDSLRSFVGEGLIAVLDSENIRVLRLPDMELICTVSLPEQHYVYDFNYVHDQLRFADGKLYFNANLEKAYTVGVAALFENEHIGAEMLEEAPAMPQVSDITDYTALNTKAPDGMTVSHGWIKKLQVEGWGRSWSVEADLITPIDAHDDLLLAQTAVGASVRDVKTSVGLYSSETDASCSMEIDTENRRLPAQFAMSPSGKVYMIEFCENNAQIYELEYARVIDVTDDPDAPKLLEPGAENLLYFTDLDALKAFLASPELSDEEFEQFVSEKLDPAMGIVTKEDAREVIGCIEQIPFPMTADLELSDFEFYFYNKRGGNYPYSIAYNMPDGGICSFFGQLEGEYSLAKDIEAYASSASPVDFDGNAFVNRLYYENFGDVHAFYADIGGRIVNAQFRNLTYDEALEALCFFTFGKAAELIGNSGQTQSGLKTDPWYLEKAWEYAELANREYGFRFYRDDWGVDEYLNAISFSYPGSEEFAGAALTVRFIEGKKEVHCADIYNGEPADAPVDYASLSEKELKRLHNESYLLNTYNITPRDMQNAGYTLDGTDLDYVKVAEYCARINAERLTGCSENNYKLCREVDIGSVFIQMMGSDPDIAYCCAAYYFLPAYPLSFLSDSIDTVCNMIAPDDAEHPGWLTYDTMGSVNITKTADGWECHTGFPSNPAIGTNDPLVANPRYLEKAWEYAEFANREYGFSFVKYYWEPFDNAIVFRASKPGMHNRQTLYVFFHELNGVEIIEPVLMGDSSDIPAGYSELGEAEREAVDREIAILPEYHVTPQDMLQAGYTLDGTEPDYIKIAEYCGRRYAAIYTSCSEINPQFCNEAEAVNARRNELMIDSAEPIYCYVTYYFRPAYPLCFTDMHGDIGCNINELDDADHPGLITFGGDVLITPTDNGWNCKIAFISGY